MASEKTAKGTISTTVNIREKFHAQIKKLAKTRGVTLAQIVRELLEFALTEKRKDKAA